MQEVDILWRLGLALVLSSAIGIERETRQKSAGLRTYSLVGVRAAAFMLVSAYGFGDVLGGSHVQLDPSRVAAQIVSGIGFIGGGIIFVRRDAVVRGSHHCRRGVGHRRRRNGLRGRSAAGGADHDRDLPRRRLRLSATRRPVDRTRPRPRRQRRAPIVRDRRHRVARPGVDRRTRRGAGRDRRSMCARAMSAKSTATEAAPCGPGSPPDPRSPDRALVRKRSDGGRFPGALRVVGEHKHFVPPGPTTGRDVHCGPAWADHQAGLPRRRGVASELEPAPWIQTASAAYSSGDRR